MKSIQLSPSASVTPTSAGVILRSELGTFQIAGDDEETFVTRMVPLLDGSRDREAIEAALGGYSRASVARFLDLLIERGLAEEAETRGGDDRRAQQMALFRRWSSAPAEAMERLSSARVILAGAEPWGEALAVDLCAAGVSSFARLGKGAIDPGCSLVVAAVAPGDAGEAERVARLSHRAGVRTLWAHLDGGCAVMGPLTAPGRTACRICADAAALNPPFGERSARADQAGASAGLLGRMVAMEAVKILSEYTPSRLGGRVWVQDLTTFACSLHTLVRLPWCRVCGDG